MSGEMAPAHPQAITLEALEASFDQLLPGALAGAALVQRSQQVGGVHGGAAEDREHRQAPPPAQEGELVGQAQHARADDGRHGVEGGVQP